MATFNNKGINETITSTTRWYGRELEFLSSYTFSNYNVVQSARAGLQHHFEYYNEIIENVKSDASLGNSGFEITLNPFTMEYYNENKHKFEQLYNVLNNIIRVRIHEGCGGHIHISRKSASNYKAVMVGRFIHDNINEIRAKYSWFRENRWCRHNGDAKNFKKAGMYTAQNYLVTHSKNVSINTTNYSYECRSIQTAKDFTTFDQQQQFIYNLWTGDYHHRKTKAHEQREILKQRVSYVYTSINDAVANEIDPVSGLSQNKWFLPAVGQKLVCSKSFDYTYIDSVSGMVKRAIMGAGTNMYVDRILDFNTTNPNPGKRIYLRTATGRKMLGATHEYGITNQLQASNENENRYVVIRQVPAGNKAVQTKGTMII